MPLPRSRTLLLFALPVALLLLPALVWGVDQIMSLGEVPRNVTVAGVPVGGLSEEDAEVVVRAYEAQLQATPATFSVNGRSYDLAPTAVGLRVETAAAVDAAMNARSNGFLSWLRSFNDPVDVPVTVVVDEAKVGEQLEQWETDAIEDRAYEGMIEVVDGRVRYEYPRAGRILDRDPAAAIVYEVLASPETDSAELPLAVDSPQLTTEDIDAAVLQVERIIGEPVSLVNETYDFTLTFTPSALADAVEVTVVDGGDARIDIGLDEAAIAAYVEPRKEPYEIAPVDATWDIDVETDTVTIVPSLNGTRVDPSLLPDVLLDAALSDANRGEFPIIETVEPEFTTEDAEAFGPLYLVSEFTTPTPGVNRVHNIQLMADTIDGTIVWPGEVFSINETVGQRTEAKGYKRDGAIIGGVVTCCDDPANVGGGVSQFGTTFFNAVFYGCYEDVEHTPHSIYFSRYPEVVEATLGYPHPDVAFRNNTDAPVIIRNTYDGTKDITVKFYGNNGGKECTVEYGERFGYTQASTRYEADPTVPPGTERVENKGSGGWSRTATRVITYPDGRVDREDFTHRYRGETRLVLVNPCDMPGSNTPCPVSVPNVVGQQQAGATAALQAAGFNVAVTKTQSSVSDAGKVFSQSPNGLQPPGSTITIVVGDGSQPDPTTTTTVPPGDG